MIRNLKIVFFLSVAIILLIWSATAMYTEVLRDLPNRTIAYWDCIGEIHSEKNWQTQNIVLSGLIRYQPYSIEINTDLGRLYDWQALNDDAWSNDAKSARKNASHYYRKVTKLKPAWANGWLNLAKSKSINQEIDSELLQSLDNAYRFGSNQTGIQTQLIWLSLGMWESLDATLKNKTQYLIRDLLHINKKTTFIITAAFRFSWVDNLRKLTSNPAILKRISFLENNPDVLEKTFTQDQPKQVCSL